MFGRILVVVAGLLAAATPVKAEEMSPEEARRFVAGKLFAYSCFDGSNGAGRIFADGSVAGTKSNAVCASLKGLPFEPCFNLTRTDANTFRGSIRGMGFASCTFTRRSPRANFARATSSPMRLRASITGADGSN